jgi:hypothetical protein
VVEGPAALADGGESNIEDNAGRDFVRIDVGIVKRNAIGLEEGVDGRVGGTM